MSAPLQGVLPALVTPLTADESFAAKSFELLLEKVYAAGCEGVYVCGQTGEGLSQPLEMRKTVAEVAVKASPQDKAVVVHIGAGRTADAVELARHAGRIGAHAVSSLPPESRFGFDEVRAYYQAIAAASDLPVLVYYFPEFSNSVRTLEQIDELCSIPNIVGLKFTDFDLYRLSLISRAGRVIFSGRDEVFAAGMLMGASGGIGSFYNLAPELFVEVWRHSRECRFAEARRVQDRINDLIRIVLAVPMLPAIKTILGWSGIACGPCFAPRRALSREEEERLRSELEKAGFA
jgi:N-acetylneuraminate lyase